MHKCSWLFITVLSFYPTFDQDILFFQGSFHIWDLFREFNIYLAGGLEHFLFAIYWDCHHPN